MLKADYLFLLYSQILIHDRTLPTIYAVAPLLN